MMIVESVGNAGLAVVPVLTGDVFNAMLKPTPDTSVLIPLHTSLTSASSSSTQITSSKIRRYVL
jgi:hypothetical protein